MNSHFASTRAFILAAIVAAGAGLHCRADIVSDCFSVVTYSANWHIECTLPGVKGSDPFDTVH